MQKKTVLRHVEKYPAHEILMNSTDIALGMTIAWSIKYAIGFSLTMTIIWEGAKGFPVQAGEVRGSRKAKGGAGYDNKIL